MLQRIKINGLTWSPDKNKASVLDNINIEFEENQFYGIIGPNGAGKSSLVRQIVGLKKPSSGNILFDNVDIQSIDKNNIAKKISFLPQSFYRDIDFNVYDVVSMGREPYRNYFQALKKEEVDIINEALEYTGCIKIKDRSMTTLSGGELQRVMIARTLVQDTPWIVLDEPVSNLDIKYQLELMDLLERLRTEKNKTIISVMHDINLAKSYCTFIVMMKDGKVHEYGNCDEVLTKEKIENLFDLHLKLFQFIV